MRIVPCLVVLALACAGCETYRGPTHPALRGYGGTDTLRYRDYFPDPAQQELQYEQRRIERESLFRDYGLAQQMHQQDLTRMGQQDALRQQGVRSSYDRMLDRSSLYGR